MVEGITWALSGWILCSLVQMKTRMTACPKENLSGIKEWPWYLSTRESGGKQTQRKNVTSLWNISAESIWSPIYFSQFMTVRLKARNFLALTWTTGGHPSFSSDNVHTSDKDSAPVLFFNKSRLELNSRESKPVAILNVSSQRGFDEKSGKENISKGKNEENKKQIRSIKKN